MVKYIVLYLLVIGERMDFHRIYAKIDLDAIAHNIKVIKNKIGGAKLMFVIKADAYGHGADRLSREFEKSADYFAVAEMREALDLRSAGIKKPIIILGYTSPALYGDAIDNDITLTVFSLDGMAELSSMAVSKGKKARVHFAVDTGMGRIGWQVCEESVCEAAYIASMEGIYAEGIFSHFSCADGDDADFTAKQTEEFGRFCSMLERRGVSIPIKHMNNSAALLELGEQYDMVRAGIVIYGLYPSEKVRKDAENSAPLRPAMELITHIAYVKELEAGRPISYGATFVTDKKMKIATLPVGYADGYPRALSGKGEVLIHGKRCRILGRICMDQMMVDVTDVPEARTGDKAVLVGRGGKDMISAEELSEAAYSINYEFICGISKRVPRVYESSDCKLQNL